MVLQYVGSALWTDAGTRFYLAILVEEQALHDSLTVVIRPALMVIRAGTNALETYVKCLAGRPLAHSHSEAPLLRFIKSGEVCSGQSSGQVSSGEEGPAQVMHQRFNSAQEDRLKSC